jgi:hypothetical protein
MILLYHFWAYIGRNASQHTKAMFIVALFTKAKLWNQPRCLSIDEWVKKMWYTYIQWSVIQLSIKMNFFAGKWMELDIIMESEISKTQKDKHCMFSLICRI